MRKDQKEREREREREGEEEEELLQLYKTALGRGDAGLFS